MAKLTIELTEQDFLACQRTHSRTRMAVRFIVGLGVALAIFVVANAVWIAASGRTRHILDLLPLALVAIGVLWISWNYLFGSPPGSRRYYRQSKLRFPLEYEWDDDGIAVRGQDMCQRHSWTDLLAWAEDNASIVLMTTSRSFVPAPKRLIPVADLAALRTHLRDVRKC